MLSRSDRAEAWGRRWLLLIAFMLVAFAWVIIGRAVAFAQGDAPAASTETGAVETDEVTPDDVNNVARELWCPLCSGVRLDACELKACDQMKDVIAIKLAEGEDTESIQAYFVEQYGPQVMGEPPRAGFNWLAWILPALAAVVGGYFFWRTTQRMMQPAIPLEASAAPLPLPRASATELDSQIAPVRTGVGEGAAVTRSEEEEYMEKLDEELSKYG